MPVTTPDGDLAALKTQVQELAAQVERLLPRTSGWIPPSASVGKNVSLAGDVKLISRDDRAVTIGDNTRIYRGAEIQGPVRIGQDCFINRDAYIRPETTLEAGVFLGPFVRIITDGHHIGEETRRAGVNRLQPVRIGAGTWVGASTTILGGVTIGQGCIIAAGALVNKDIPPNTLAGGVPARVIRHLGAQSGDTPESAPPMSRLSAFLMRFRWPVSRGR